MRISAILGLGIALVATGPAQGQGFDYDCDTPAAHFSAVKTPARTGAQRISGSITVHALYSAERYLTAGLADIEARGAGGWRVQLGVTGRASESKERLTGVLRIRRPDVAEPQTYTLGAFTVGDAPIPFELTLDANGQGRAQLGGQAMTFAVPAGQESRASLTCSTGDILFSGVSFGS